MSEVKERAKELLKENIHLIGCENNMETVWYEVVKNLLASLEAIEAENAELKAKELDYTVVYMSGHADGKAAGIAEGKRQAAEEIRNLVIVWSPLHGKSNLIAAIRAKYLTTEGSHE